MSPTSPIETIAAKDDFSYGTLSIQAENKELKQFNEVISSPAVKKHVHGELLNLREKVSIIKYGFRQVYEDLRRFEREHVRRENKHELSQQWKELQKRFNVLMDKSHEDAVKAAGFLQMYSTGLLTKTDESRYESLRVELQSLLETLDKHEAGALENKSGFSALADDLGDFCSDIDDTVEDVTGSVTAELTEAKAHCNKLSLQVQDLSQQARKTGLACMSSLSVGAVAVGFAVLTLSPAAVVTAVTSMFAAAGSSVEYFKIIRERSCVRDEAKEWESKKEMLMSENDVLKKLTNLEKTKEDVKQLREQVDIIADIWQKIRGDMQHLKTYLELTVGPDAPITQFLPEKLELAATLYKELAGLLELYGKGSTSELSASAQEH
ncbi:hypothetical protein BD309DRAFT_964469 [Dichomitus squalens]|uniref:Uncharacterized protein n=2 Tax=Dichomitus squalens TaxID=114155 RepID=A0A4Q9NKB9_9APHY|nr:uncharacterized protein DICSQDRAFT_173031 [Dichomitus squalens LYAD-421 SS1]EJF58351.1 hypothetical protein DICSQDRAFT_173031 [Dichomitus squalens LYAD-421 SS1]TBU41780.1 hypothetical protein BD309DRAFT_964469 [Dichomitus squalens]TBU60849.1 hypothetical protein BD310DRAFT_847051 [Dichomitus squalens]